MLLVLPEDYPTDGNRGSLIASLYPSVITDNRQPTYCVLPDVRQQGPNYSYNSCRWTVTQIKSLDPTCTLQNLEREEHRDSLPNTERGSS